MSRATWGVVCLLFLFCAGTLPAAEPEPRLSLLVPAYFYPAGEGLKHWDRLIASSARVPVLAIVNPVSGPGDKADANYTKLLDRARRQAGLTLLGYVSTRYARRPLADVQADVDRWLRLYPQDPRHLLRRAGQWRRPGRLLRCSVRSRLQGAEAPPGRHQPGDRLRGSLPDTAGHRRRLPVRGGRGFRHLEAARVDGEIRGAAVRRPGLQGR
jgi:spherulation-specific family 4 protein